jgi:hypothetical protein
MDYDQAPEQLRTLIDELSQAGDYLVVNDDDQLVALISSLPDTTKMRRLAAAKRLNTFLDAIPTSSLSEEETIALVNEAITALKQDKQASASTTQ